MAFDEPFERRGVIVPDIQLQQRAIVQGVEVQGITCSLHSTQRKTRICHGKISKRERTATLCCRGVGSVIPCSAPASMPPHPRQRHRRQCCAGPTGNLRPARQVRVPGSSSPVLCQRPRSREPTTVRRAPLAHLNGTLPAHALLHADRFGCGRRPLGGGSRRCGGSLSVGIACHAGGRVSSIQSGRVVPPNDCELGLMKKASIAGRRLCAPTCAFVAPRDSGGGRRCRPNAKSG